MRHPAFAPAWFAAGLLAFAAAARGGFESAPSLAWNAAATSTGLICWAVAGASLSAGSVARRLGWIGSGLSPVILCGLVLGMLATSQVAEWLIALAGYEHTGNLAEFRRTLTAVGGRDLVVALFGIALLPGFAEELALRGFVQRGLEARVGALAAVVATSLIFALLHGEPVHAAGAFLLGLYLGSIVALCGSIRPAVLCHVLNNAAATLGTAFDVQALGILLVAAGLVAGPWALWRTALQARSAHPPLGGTPESLPPMDPPSGHS